jgi:hypothetical protein
MYFLSPEVNIYGVDLDDKTLQTARNKASTDVPSTRGEITFFNGKHVELHSFGPYDIIFANSVLCRHPMPGDVRGSVATFASKYYSMDDFSTNIKSLDAALKVGGLLAIVNANYNFMDTDTATRYRPLPSKCPGHFVPRVDPINSVFVDNTKNEVECVYVKES